MTSSAFLDQSKPLAQFSADLAKLRELLHYEPETGELRWRHRTGRCNAGSVAGSVSKRSGYRYVNVQKRTFAAHRLAWLHQHGAWPVGDVDHVNGVRDDNRISNLREATRRLNLQNQRSARRRSLTGFLGVCVVRNRSGQVASYKASICCNYKLKSLGHFPTPEAAHEAYLVAKRRLHEGCTL